MAGDLRPKDIQSGMNMIFEALRKGYDFGVGSLWLRARELNYVDLPSRKLMYCWSYLDSKYRNHEPDSSLDVYINSKAPVDERPALNQELDQLRQWHPCIEDCIQLTQKIFGE